MSTAHPTPSPPAAPAASTAQGAPVPPVPSPSSPPDGLPDGIEIFRAGTHIDDQGRRHTFTPAMLAEMAASYNRAAHDAPLVVGHPQHNLPAYGWVRRVYVNAAGNLAIDADRVDPAFARMVRDGRFAKRSASFYPPDAPHNPTPGRWSLRHVGFLGAQPPAVQGLRDIEFAAADVADAVCISLDFAQGNAPDTPIPHTPTTNPPEESPMTIPATTPTHASPAPIPPQHPDSTAEVERLRAELAASQSALREAQQQVASFSEAAAVQRQATFVSFAEAEVKAGRLLPKDRAICVATLCALTERAEPISFSEGSHTSQFTPLELCAWLQGQMSSRRPIVQFGEIAAGAVEAGLGAGASDAEVDAAARRWQQQHPSVSYAEALHSVLSFQTAGAA